MERNPTKARDVSWVRKPDLRTQFFSCLLRICRGGVAKFVRMLLVILGLPCGGTSASAQGIPEPSLILYGSVMNRSTGQVLPSGQVTWQITNHTDSVSLSANIITVNDQSFYIAVVPLETRFVGSQTLPASTNSLGLSSALTTFSRMATFGGAALSIAASSRGMFDTFTLAANDRGVIERLDLDIGGGETFAQWLTRWGLPANTLPNTDPLGKGMTYNQQWIAGTDPTDKNSIFEFVDIKPTSQGLTLIWSSANNKSYTIERVESLSDNFANGGNLSILQQHILATPPLNTLNDTNGPAPGQHFYRIRVE